MNSIARRAAAVLLLPLSVVPFVLLGPQIAESHRNFVRTRASGPLPPPEVVPSAAELARWRPLPAYQGVPVISYPATGVTRAALARQMEMLQRAGARTVSIHQYSRFRRRLPAGLPARPLLLSFYGGRLDTFKAADRVLQRHGFRATMFVNAREVRTRNPAYLSWRELHAMERSGRWDVQAGPYASNVQVTVDASGQPGEPYAYRRFTRSAGQETFADWQARVARDIFDARAAMVAQGFDPVAFSLPSANYGQRASNDGRIGPWVQSLLSEQFPVVLAGSGFSVGAHTTADALYRWLAR
jgi:hypothetical protein